MRRNRRKEPMNCPKKNSHFSQRTHLLPPKTMLTILFSFTVFVTLVITMLIVGVGTLLLVNTDILSEETLMIVPHIPVMVFALVSIVTGTVVAALISKIPMRPVNILINGMDKLANGEFDTRIQLGDMHIAQELQESFNSLAAELSQTEMLRSDFVNNFSHEFKTPIVSIRGFARLLQKGNLSQEKEAEYLDIIVEEISRLADLSTNALNLTKIENQAILTDVSTYNLSEQIRRSILLLEQKWTKKGLTIEPEFSEYMIEANEELLKQVWINLLDNAIKFSPENQMIHCRILDEEDQYIVEVQNFGSPIDEEDIDKLFNKYWQGDTSHASAGSGIGLSIVKSVIALHHGSINIDSNSIRTIFSVTLPKERI